MFQVRSGWEGEFRGATDSRKVRVTKVEKESNGRQGEKTNTIKRTTRKGHVREEVEVVDWDCPQ
jgi:hypothetical protein